MGVVSVSVWLGGVLLSFVPVVPVVVVGLVGSMIYDELVWVVWVLVLVGSEVVGWEVIGVIGTSFKLSTAVDPLEIIIWALATVF